MVIMGIDPGLATIGYGIINFSGKKTPVRKKEGVNPFSCLGFGKIETSPALATPERLKKIYTELNRLIKQYQPAVMAVETIYFFKNLRTAMPVSQAKGVILLAAAKNKIPVLEVTPLQVKIDLVGRGRAEKPQVQQVIKIILSLEEIPRPDDIADALAVAICGAGRLNKKEDFAEA